MNANQAQAGINRLLQLGGTSPASRVVPMAEGSVNERSFDQHMRQIDAREVRPRPESSKPRRDDDRSHSPEHERAVVEGARRAAPGVEPRAAEKKEKEAPRAPAEEVAQKSVVGGKVTAVEDAADTAVESRVVTSKEAETGDLLGLVAGTPPLEGLADIEGSGKPVGDVLNGGALSGERLSSESSLDASAGDESLIVTDTLPVDEVVGAGTPILASVGSVLPVTPAHVAETVAAVAGPALPYKAGLESRAQASAGVSVSSSAVSDEGNVLPLSDSISLSGDAKVTSKNTATTLLGEQNGVVKPASAMTPQADQWFKALAAEANGSEVRPSPVNSVTGSAIADMARMQNRIASPMAAQGAMGPLQTQVKTPFGEGQWGGAIAERVAFLASQRVSAAEIHLNPAELGPLQVRVTLNQEQASVSFVAQHAVVREALDQGAFRLREMLDAEGLDLVDMDVSGQSFAEQDSEAGEGGGGRGDEAASDTEEQPAVTSVRTSLVDHFV